MIVLVWMCGLAWATPELPAEEPSSGMDESEVLPEPVQAEPPTQRALLEEAVALRRVGAFDEAAVMLAKARETPGEVDEQVAYHSGVLLEVTEQWGKQRRHMRR